jgi:alpha-L-rhamnosidase
VKASWESTRGPVRVHWRIEGGEFLLSLELPPGMTGDVLLPAGSRQKAESGRHEFRAPYKR